MRNYLDTLSRRVQSISFYQVQLKQRKSIYIWETFSETQISSSDPIRKEFHLQEVFLLPGIQTRHHHPSNNLLGLLIKSIL